MDKGKPSQLELFSQDNPAGAKDHGSRPGFFSGIAVFERHILFIIGFILASVVSFCMGVEKGKRLNTARIESIQTLPVQVQAAAKEELPKESAVSIKEESKPAAKELAGYTIQVASYKTSGAAQKEVEQLRKRGLDAVATIPKGEYIIVCVGSFPSKEAANNLITRLKGRYQDCFIRRL